MNLEINDKIIKLMNESQINESQINDVIINYDAIKTLNGKIQTFSIYLKKFADFHILVCTRSKGDRQGISMSLKIPKQLAERLYDENPLLTLEKFVDLYGLELIIGGTRKPFIIGETMLIEDSNLPWSVYNPHNNKFITNIWFEVNSDSGVKQLNILAGYCLNVDSYLDMLNNNGIYESILYRDNIKNS